MQELVGRLTSLAPDVGESLKVIVHFDALVSAGAGVNALLRAAAALAGVPAGVEDRGVVKRQVPARMHNESAVGASRSPRRPIPNGEVWLERIGALHANDAMIVERLALAVQLVQTRRQPESAVAIAVGADRLPEERQVALARLRLAPEQRVRVVALPGDAADPASVPVATGSGLVRVVLDKADHPVPARAGVGTWVRASQLPESWAAALTALRLTDRWHPVVDATDLGALLPLAAACDPASPPADVRALGALDSQARTILRALVEAPSVRAAAASLGMHHSTLQARHAWLTSCLGYDPRSPIGCARYVVADLLLWLVSSLGTRIGDGRSVDSFH